MTRKLLNWGDEVIDLRERLTAARVETGSYVHIDWLRFTVYLNRLPLTQQWTPRGVDVSGNFWQWRDDQIARVVAQLKADEERHPAHVAQRLADSVILCLNGQHGQEFSTATTLSKGMDFYRYRLPILRNGQEVGWVGFFSSSDSPQQEKQRNTVHVNIHGTACTFAATGWRERLQDLIQHHEAEITRVDLALDYFDGLPGGLEGVQLDYQAGLCDVDGRHPKCSNAGDWANDDENRTGGRSFYIGSREAGKQTNVYEKGLQLFPLPLRNPWVRIELRYGNKLRDIPTDVMTRPADYFAGASEWHAFKLKESTPPTDHGDGDSIKCRPRLQQSSVHAAASRVYHWLKRTAAPAMTALFRHDQSDTLLATLFESVKLPARLAGFGQQELNAAFGRLSPS